VAWALAEEIADDIALVTETQDEVLVPIVGVVLHNVQQNRLLADWNQRLRDAIGRFPHSQTHATTEQHYLHRQVPSCLLLPILRVGLGGGVQLMLRTG